jgi:quercetin dioxygenase-like cupin family protein
MTSFQEFEATARAEGFDEVLERRWQAQAATAPHAHPFSVKGLVVAGQMSLAIGDQARELRPGDTFAVERGVQHAERYGDEGATVWVARRH